MSSFNLLSREIAIKVVYYGPGLGGKTSSLQFIHRALKPDSRGQLVSLATGVDRTLYFDFLPVKLPKLRGFSVRVQLYTVPGQVHYNSTRKLVLTGADGVVFVADSQRDRLSANVESLENLVENLREQGLALKNVPFVLQYNKRDAPNAISVEELDSRLNQHKVPAFETVATKGTGIFEALKAITSVVISDVRRKSTSQGSPDIAPVPTDLTPVPGSFDPTRPRRSVHTIPPQAASEAGATLSSLGEVADAIEKLSPETRPSGLFRLPSSAAPARSLGDLLPPGNAREALVGVENDIEQGGWASAIKHVAGAFRDLSAKLAGSLARSADEAPALAALLTGIPANRFLSFREAEGRAQSGGAVTSTDAIFALFFLADFALRAEELRKGSP
ncbi:MAG: GTPase domain-containing protein [Deltaproteobacteria bacterium]|nr:GTPase domain-containing protein [Deltaproteobacteria bacterium]